MDRGAWWATVHSITKSQTQLKQFSLHAAHVTGTQVRVPDEQQGQAVPKHPTLGQRKVYNKALQGGL